MPDNDIERERKVVELDKLRLEIRKLDLERQKLGKDLKNVRFVRKYERLKIVAALPTFLLALSALVTIGWTVSQYFMAAETRLRERVAALIQDLGSEAAQTRANGAIQLGTLVEDTSQQAAVASSLAFALGLESNMQVQVAIAATLRQIGAPAVEPLESLVQEVSAEIVPLFDDLYAATTGGASAVALRHEIESGIRQRQNAIITAAFLLAAIRCTDAACPVDLAGRPLKYFRFVGTSRSFTSANFTGAILEFADFFEVGLEGADFEGALLAGASFGSAALRGADFSHADMAPPDEDATRRAVFYRADLAGARFDEACLSGADFRGATIDVQGFRTAYLAGALFDADDRLALEQAGISTKGECPP